ncbi:MAG: tyrosine recombinase [Acidobacteria bacterium]|nr:tyrosine recombinase [Acidobacteriota bacterium]
MSLEPSSISTEVALSEYLQWLIVEKGRSPATIEAYRRDINALCGWMSKEQLTLDALSESVFETYVGQLRSGARAESSVSRAISSLRGWFGFLVEEGVLATDPTARVKSARHARSLPKPLEETLILRILDSIADSSPAGLRDRALLELLYGTGVRVSEAIGIGLEDLDFDEELILVTGKGSKQRLVPIGAALRRALERYLGAGGRNEFANSKRSSALFLNARGGRLSRQGVDLVVNRRALLAGVNRDIVSAHVFRHSCATHMLAHGADIRVVQELLGHASIATTQLYTAVSVSSLKREYLNAHPRAHG